MNTLTPSIAVVIATKGRPHVLAETLASIAQQTLLPGQVILSVSCADDLPVEMPTSLQVDSIVGPAGLPIQRNAARSLLREDAEIVFLLDDDIELAADYLERVVEVLGAHPEIGLVGGKLLSDGGVTRSEAMKILEEPVGQSRSELFPLSALYGCNMCVRAGILRAVAFDENLRFYGWLEDVDWSVRAGRCGAIMCCPAARAVHLRVNVGRMSGYRFGYAQVMNPYYLYKKGIFPKLREVLSRHWLRSLLANLWGFVRMDREADRWGRLCGNMRAYNDVYHGRSDPKGIELI
jgi:GT2 family glycosyltransferase